VQSQIYIDGKFRCWLARNLVGWFRGHQRNLPWRASRDPYTIWVSEVMLQQTQVATVIPYFQRFLAAFPTVKALAAAAEEDVLRLWEGLGYYRRARALHQAARQLQRDHEGVIPPDAKIVGKLPGFGRYTTAAVLSQAFDQRLPILEANSLRVLCRLFALRGNPRVGPLYQLLWQIAEDILPKCQVGEFNQSIMELGALICTNDSPQCPQCPLRNRCAAHRLGLQGQLPELPARPVVIEQDEVAVVVWRGAEVLIGQRPTASRWAGLWEFPHGQVETGASHQDEASKWLQQLAGIRADIGTEIATIRHGVTRFRIRMVCLEADHLAGKFHSDFYQQGRWVRLHDLDAYPFSSPQRKLARLVGRPRQSELF
jgi:A/G-specific adenine glycosylase